MKSIARFFTLALLAAAACPAAFAVTKEEMDQARVETAKLYVRFANNSAGYLDEVNPTTLDDLQRVLKNDKDRDNLKTFLKASVANDYAGWNKDQLVAYWSGEFLNSNKSVLNTEVSGNSLMRLKVKGAVQKMKVSQASAETVSPQESQAEEVTAGTEPSVDELKQAEEATQAEMAQTAEEIASEQEAIDETKAVEEENSRKGSGTWVYIMVLAILVAVVIALVMYASKTMKAKPSSAPSGKEHEREEAERRQPVVMVEGGETAEDTYRRERYAETLAEKNDEIRLLSRKVNELNDRVALLKAENERLKAQIEDAAAARDATRKSAVTSDERYMPLGEREEPRPRQAQYREEASDDEKVIYLGRVNSRGIFVRADRTMKPGMSIYRLTTSNGLTGTFTVVEDRSVVDTAFEDPGKWLVGGCVSKEIFNTDRCREIITETPGTAVFEEGAWRVIRKAKIRYE